MNTTACLSFKAFQMGTKSAWPRYVWLSPYLVNSVTPSAFSSSSAYAISASAADVFVKVGIAAKKPYLDGFSSRKEARYSFVCRASLAASSPSRVSGPGAVREKIVVVMPRVLENFSSSARVHVGVHEPDGSPLPLSNA